MQVARLTFELLRPVPIEPLRLSIGDGPNDGPAGEGDDILRVVHIQPCGPPGAARRSSSCTAWVGRRSTSRSWRPYWHGGTES
jgi:hypothetical protein